METEIVSGKERRRKTIRTLKPLILYTHNFKELKTHLVDPYQLLSNLKNKIKKE